MILNPWLLHFQRILPSVAPPYQFQAGLDLCRMWTLLGQYQRAQQGLHQLLQNALILPPLEKVRGLALWAMEAHRARWDTYALQALQQATHMALQLSEPHALAQVLPPVFQAWQDLGQPASLATFLPLLDVLIDEDPSTAVDLAAQLVRAAQHHPVPHLWEALNQHLRQWDPLSLAYLLPQLEPPTAKPALHFVQALGERLLQASPTSQTLTGLAAAVRFLVVSEGKRGDSRFRAEEWLHEGIRRAHRLPQGLPQTEALAQLALAAAALQHPSAPHLFHQAVQQASIIGFMDDRARVLRPLLESLALLQDPSLLALVWPPLREIGYPRFFAPLARSFIHIARQLNAPAWAHKALRTGLDWLRQEEHWWKGLVLLEGLAPVLSPQDSLEEATQWVLALPPEWQGRGIAALASVWAHHRLWSILEQIREQTLHLPEPRARQQALEAVLSAWGQYQPHEALRWLQEHLEAFTYPHVLSRVAVKLLERAQTLKGPQEVEP